MISESHFFFFFQKILNCSLQYELPAHSYQDLILNNEPYKGTMYSSVLLNSYWIRLSLACSLDLASGASIVWPTKDVFESLLVLRPSIFSSKSVKRAWLKKPRGIYWPPAQGGIYFSFSRARRCFRKERKEKKSLVNFSETSIKTMATPVNCACKVLLKDPYM